MNASFEEKSVWITLASLLTVFGYYFVVAGGLLAEGVTELAPYLPLLVVTVVLLVVVLVAAHTIVAIASRPDGRDERDRIISWRAEHNSSWLLATGVLGAIFGLALSIEAVWIANGLMFALFLSEVLGHSLQLFYYRRGL